MKIFIFITIFFTSLIASENATKDDIKMLLEVTNKRFEQVDKRFEDMHKYMDKRFEQVDKRFEQVNKRFETMQNSMDKRFESMQKYMDKQFESRQNSMDKRFESMQKYMDKRFEDMNSSLRLMMMVFGSLFGLMFLYLIKDRYSIKKDVQIELAKEFETQMRQKADKELLDRVVTIIEEMAKKNNFVREILNKHNLILKT